MRSTSARLVDALEQDRELVAAEARDRVRGTRRLDEALGGGLQQAVARIVAERVVDVLEVVEVEEHDRDALAASDARASSACWTRLRNRLRLASSVSGSWKASWRSCSSSALRSLTSRKLSARPAIAGSSSRLLPTLSSVLRRAPLPTTTSTGPIERPCVEATSTRNAASRSRSASPQRSSRLRPTRSSGCMPKVRSAAGEAKRSRPSTSAIMITSEAFLISEA